MKRGSKGKWDVEIARTFDDLKEICLHPKAHGVTSVAMESTGNYWQNLYVELEKTWT